MMRIVLLRLIMTYIQPNITTSYQTLLQFNLQSLLDLLRQWFKHQSEPANATYEIPVQFQHHVQQCYRIVQHRDIDGEVYDVLVVHVRRLKTWVYQHQLLHSIAVNALRRLTILPDFRAIVVFVAPDGVQWRMQYIEQEFESYEDPNTAKFKTRRLLTPPQRYIIDFSAQGFAYVPFAYWDDIKACVTPVHIRYIKGAFMALPTTPTEAFVRSYEESIAAIEAYERDLQTSATKLSFAERAKIHEQLVKLHQLADQWQRVAQPLMHLMQIDNNIVMTDPVPVAKPSGDALTLSDSWRFRKPFAIRHNGQTYQVKNWQGVYAVVIHVFISTHGESFINAMNSTMSASAKPFLSQNAEIFDRAAQTDGWYYEATQSADQIAGYIKRMYQLP